MDSWLSQEEEAHIWVLLQQLIKSDTAETAKKLLFSFPCFIFSRAGPGHFLLAP